MKTKSKCSEAKVQGRIQNKCKLSELDARSGTRLLIETSKGYKTVGGATIDNLDTSFNVDQIRHNKDTISQRLIQVKHLDTFGDRLRFYLNLLIQNPCKKTNVVKVLHIHH